MNKIAKPTIALCVIAKDKEVIIERMLNSTQGVFDLYCLQDTGSTDKTIEVFKNWCKNNKKKFKTSQKFVGSDYKSVAVDGKELLGDFGTARNDSFKLAKGCDFAFWIDTDDILINPQAIRPVLERMTKEGIAIALLTYIYARGSDGLKPVVQKRERILNIKMSGQWKDRVHETYEINQPVKVVEVPEIQVEHLRTAYEAVSTGRRNNIIMTNQLNEEGLENFSDKMLHNLAFDHWEHREFKEAIMYYKMLVNRMVSINNAEALYGAYIKIAVAYLNQNKPLKAIKYCLKASLIAPRLAEPYVTMAQSYAMLNRWEEAATYAKKVLKLGVPNTTAPINEYEFLITPRKILEQYYLFAGNNKKAMQIANEIVKISPQPGHKSDKFRMQSEIIKQEAVKGILSLARYVISSNEVEMMDRIKTAIPLELKDEQRVREVIKELTLDYNRKSHSIELPEKKNIVIYAGGHYEPWDGNSDREKGIGGSEGMCIQLSRELARIGNKVIVYNECGESDGVEIDGVLYIDWRKFDTNLQCDVFISLRRPDIFQTLLRATKQYLWLHDTEYGDLPVEIFYAPNKVIVLSEAHKEVIKQNHGITDDSVFYMSRNGLNKNAIEWADKSKGKRDINKFIYASSYDRGLDRVLEMWPKIKESNPKATLDIYYGWNTFDAMMEARQGMPQGEYMKNYKNKITTMITRLAPYGVTEVGRVSQNELYRAFGEAGFWLYPTEFYEISCINAMTAQAMGCIPICTNLAALKETVGEYGYKLELSEILEASIYLSGLGEELNEKRIKMIEWAREKYDMTTLAKEWSNYFSEKL